MSHQAGGWTKSHPIPADKGRLGTFTVLSQENKQVIREILESTDIPTTDVARSYDEQTLHKLRGMYASCMDEDTLNDLAEEPLWDFVKTVRDLFRGKSTEISSKKKDGDKYNGLTAAIAFLHSRGEAHCTPKFYMNIYHLERQMWMLFSLLASKGMSVKTRMP